MDRLREFLEAVRQHGYARGNFLGLLHVLIGRRIARADGTLVSGGLTWKFRNVMSLHSTCPLNGGMHTVG